MKVFKTVALLMQNLSSIDSNKTLGFVPTMGALHEGHLSIVKKAKKENDLVIVSIFVNPTQFDKADDLKAYPKTIENDLKLLRDVHCDFVFIPNVEDIYPKKVKSITFDFDGLDKVMEGAFRTGHFDGVGTVVKRLFEIVKPTRAYFGEKDFQQLQIIKKMVEKSKMDVQIIPCEIYRENDGLAMSSRNTRLSKKQREEAPLIQQTLLKCKNIFPEREISDIKKMVEDTFKKNETLQLEYFEIADSQTLLSAKNKIPYVKYRGFIAVFAGKVRLIDNIALN
jgi:pantoate--beta-alanine ligase